MGIIGKDECAEFKKFCVSDGRKLDFEKEKKRLNGLDEDLVMAIWKYYGEYIEPEFAKECMKHGITAEKIKEISEVNKKPIKHYFEQKFIAELIKKNYSLDLINAFDISGRYSPIQAETYVEGYLSNLTCAKVDEKVAIKCIEAGANIISIAHFWKDANVRNVDDLITYSKMLFLSPEGIEEFKKRNITRERIEKMISIVKGFSPYDICNLNDVDIKLIKECYDGAMLSNLCTKHLAFAYKLGATKAEEVYKINNFLAKKEQQKKQQKNEEYEKKTEFVEDWVKKVGVRRFDIMEACWNSGIEPRYASALANHSTINADFINLYNSYFNSHSCDSEKTSEKKVMILLLAKYLIDSKYFSKFNNKYLEDFELDKNQEKWAVFNFVSGYRVHKSKEKYSNSKFGLIAILNIKADKPEELSKLEDGKKKEQAIKGGREIFRRLFGVFVKWGEDIGLGSLDSVIFPSQDRHYCDDVINCFNDDEIFYGIIKKYKNLIK